MMRKFDLLRIYQALPYTLQVAVASLQGLREQMLRYSTETDSLVAESIEREHWSITKWDTWQKELLSQQLWFSSKHVQNYRQQWKTRRQKGDRASIEILSSWQVLSKNALQEHPKDYVADGVVALLVPPNDRVANAGAVERILTEPGLATKLSTNARKKAEWFDWSIILPMWEKLLNEFVGER